MNYVNGDLFKAETLCTFYLALSYLYCATSMSFPASATWDSSKTENWLKKRNKDIVEFWESCTITTYWRTDGRTEWYISKQPTK